MDSKRWKGRELDKLLSLLKKKSYYCDRENIVNCGHVEVFLRRKVTECLRVVVFPSEMFMPHGQALWEIQGPFVFLFFQGRIGSFKGHTPVFMGCFIRFMHAILLLIAEFSRNLQRMEETK